MISYFPPRKHLTRKKKARVFPSDYFLVSALLNRHDRAVKEKKNDTTPTPLSFTEDATDAVVSELSTQTFDSINNAVIPTRGEEPNVYQNTEMTFISPVLLHCKEQNGKTYFITLEDFNAALDVEDGQCGCLGSDFEVESSEEIYEDLGDDTISDITSFLSAYFIECTTSI